MAYIAAWSFGVPHAEPRPGEWRAETWPPAGLTPMTLYLQPDHRLSPAAAAGGRDLLRFVPSAGVEAGFWWGGLLTDQRPVGAFSLTYDYEILSGEVANLCLPPVSLQCAAD